MAIIRFLGGRKARPADWPNPAESSLQGKPIRESDRPGETKAPRQPAVQIVHHAGLARAQKRPVLPTGEERNLGETPAGGGVRPESPSGS
jgi:hypothetical protein